MYPRLGTFPTKSIPTGRIPPRLRALYCPAGDVDDYNAFGEELYRFGDAFTRFGYQGTAWMRHDSGLLIPPTQLYVPGRGRFIQTNPWPGVRLRFSASAGSTLGRWAAWAVRRALARLVSRARRLRLNLYDYLRSSPPGLVEPYSEGIPTDPEPMPSEEELQEALAELEGIGSRRRLLEATPIGQIQAYPYYTPEQIAELQGDVPLGKRISEWLYCFIRCMDPWPENPTQALYAAKNGVKVYRGSAAALEVIKAGGSYKWTVAFKTLGKGVLKPNPYLLVAEAACCIFECSTDENLLAYVVEAAEKALEKAAKPIAEMERGAREMIKRGRHPAEMFFP